MIDLSNLPVEDESEARSILQRVDAHADRFETGDGSDRVVWRKWGKGPRIVLFHGSHGDWAHWLRNIPGLARHHEVWAADLPGMGDSALPDKSEHATIVAPIAAGMSELGLTAAPVVGFSLGGVLGAHLASLRPELVASLIVVDSGGLDTPLGPFQLKPMKGLDATQRREANRDNLASMMIADPAKVDELAIEIQTLGARKHRLNVEPLVMPDHLLRVLPDIQAPISAVWGTADAPHPDPGAQERALRARRPDIRFRTIEGAGHWCIYEAPEQFNAIALELINA